MSVIVTEGVPGSGKTFDTVVRFLIPALMAEVEERDDFTKQLTGRKFRRPIYTNIEGLNILKLAELAGRTYEQVKAQIVEVRSAAEWRNLLQHDREDSASLKIQHFLFALVLIDEAQMIYPKGDFRNTPQAFKDLLAWHRHVSMDMVFLTQSANTMETYISEICDRCYSVKNLGFITALVKGLYVIHVREKPRQPNYATLKGRYDPKYFGTYKSNQGGESFKLAVPNAIGGVMASLVLGSVLFLGVRFYSHGVLTTPGGVKRAVSPAAAVSPVLGVVAAPLPVAVGLRDSVADLPGLSPAPAAQLPAASAVALGLDPKKTCYQVPVRSTWTIKYHGQTERGWKDDTRNLCF